MATKIECWKSEDGKTYQSYDEARIADTVHATRMWSIGDLENVVLIRKKQLANQYLEQERIRRECQKNPPLHP